MAASTLYELERGDQRSSTRLHRLCKVLGLNIEFVEHGRGPRLLSEGKAPLRVEDQALTYSLHHMQITPEEVEFGIEWGKLEEPARSFVRQQVFLLVAEQKRRARSNKQPDPAERQPRKPS